MVDTDWNKQSEHSHSSLGCLSHFCGCFTFAAVSQKWITLSWRWIRQKEPRGDVSVIDEAQQLADVVQTWPANVFHLATGAVPSVHLHIQVTVSRGETHPLSNGYHRELRYWMIHQINGARQSPSDFLSPACAACSLCILHGNKHLALWIIGTKDYIRFYCFNKVEIEFIALFPDVITNGPIFKVNHTSESVWCTFMSEIFHK